MKKIMALIAFTVFALASIIAFDPATLPAELQEYTPHHPKVVRYVVDRFVEYGQMTQAEADATVAYMTMRYERRQNDLRAVQGMTREERRAYMQARRQERGNPLVEYAQYTHMTHQRAGELMDIMHRNPKGQKYLKRLDKKNAEQNEPTNAKRPIDKSEVQYWNK